MAQPPKTKRKLGAVARAELGQRRECDACGDTKEVSERTYTPSNKGFRGWSTTCKVCQAAASSGRKSLTKVEKPTLGAAPSKTDLDELIDAMYFQSLTPQPDLEVLDHCVGQLGGHVRQLHEAGRKEESFRAFVRIVKPLVANWMEPGTIHDDIIAGLMSEHRRRLIIATRYSAKSTITAIYVAWRIFLDPLLKVMVISRGSKLAARMLRTVRQVFIANCPVLAHLVPTEDCLDNAEQFQVPQALQVTTGGATLTSLGITSNLPGYRSDLTIGDDVEGPQEDTPEKVQELNETLAELTMINPRGEKVMLGTYQSEFSIYAHLGAAEDVDGNKVWEEHRACMFEETEVDGRKFYSSRWPAMFSDADAHDWRQSVTERSWRLHAMLIADPSILNERPLKIKDFILVNWPPQSPRFPVQCVQGGEELTSLPTWGAPKGDVWLGPRTLGEKAESYAMTVVAIDPASGLAGRDAIGVAVLGITQSGLGVVRHLEGVRGPDKLRNITRVAEIVRFYNADAVIVEELADGLFGETLETHLMLVEYPMAVSKVTTGGQQKGRRIIETLAPPMGNGRLVMLEKVARSDHGGEFVAQLVRITWDGRTGKAKDHDDIVDALAHAVGFCKGHLVSDSSDAIGELRAAKMEEWRGLPLRFGGLGGSEQDQKNCRVLAVGGGGLEEGTMAERLIEEDRELARLQERKGFLQEQLAMRVRAGVDPQHLEALRRRIIGLDKVIRDLKEMQVL